MKNQIEKKLGCTIEECCKKMYDSHSKLPTETEIKSPFSVLTPEELDFVIEYLESHI